MKFSTLLLSIILLTNILSGETIKDVLDDVEAKSNKSKEKLAKKLADGEELSDIQKRLLDGTYTFTRQWAIEVCNPNRPLAFFGYCTYEDDAVVRTESFLINHPNIDVQNMRTGTFLDADPYNNKGNYYLAFGVILQRIDANSILISDPMEAIGYKGTAYITGLKGLSVREGQVFMQWVKGTGEYTYKNALGVKKIVPKGVFVK